MSGLKAQHERERGLLAEGILVLTECIVERDAEIERLRAELDRLLPTPNAQRVPR